MESKRYIDKDFLGNLNHVQERFYEDLIESLPDEERGKVRKLVEEDLIFETKKQRLALLGDYIKEKHKINKNTLKVLVDGHLLRMEPDLRTGGYTYELSHDNLIEPVLNFRASRKKENIEQGKRIGLLFSTIIVFFVGLGILVYIDVLRKEKQQAVEKRKSDVSTQQFAWKISNYITQLKFTTALNTLDTFTTQNDSILSTDMLKEPLGKLAFYYYYLDKLDTARLVLQFVKKNKVDTTLGNLTIAESTQRLMGMASQNTLTKKLSHDMVEVKGGIFDMGRDDHPSQTFSPKHKVKLSSYYICKYETTAKQYALFCLATNRPMPANITDTLPATNISRQDAKNYCVWMSKKTGQKYRLPTEAEWEYAATGGNRTNNYCYECEYSGSNTLDSVGWYAGNSLGVVHRVGTLNNNRLGIFDMSGNVREWVEDIYISGFYQVCKNKGMVVNPKAVVNFKMKHYGNIHLVRGGSIYTPNGKDGFGCRVYDRLKVDKGKKLGPYGFRVVMEKE